MDPEARSRGVALLEEEEIRKGFRAWLDLMDFSWEFALAIYPRNFPGRDVRELLREDWRRKGEEHSTANLRLAGVLARGR